MAEVFQPHDYQKRVVRFAKNTPNCALWLDMGMGKTVTSLTVAADLLDSFEASRVLVVAPKKVARNTWPNEIKKWHHTQLLSVAVALGSATDRKAALDRETDILVINRENFTWLVKLFDRDKWPFDMIIWDESSGLKDMSAQRTKAMRFLCCSLPRYEYEKAPNGKRKRVALPSVPPVVDRVIELTGTPTSTSLINLWSQVYLLDEGKRLGRTLDLYKARWFKPVDRDQRKWVPKEGAKEQIFEVLRDIAVSLDAKDYLKTPKFVDVPVRVTLDNEAMRQYRHLEQEFVAQIAGESIVAKNAAVKSGKLRQCANGAVYFDVDRNWVKLHDEKLDALEDIVESSQGEPILVAYNFKSDLQRIRNRFPDAVVMDDDPETEARWNRGEIPMLLVHPQGDGYGLNLQAGGSVIVWFSLPWSFEQFAQMNKRLDRQGQTKPGRIYMLIAEGTIDETLVSVLRGHAVTSSELLRAVRLDMEERLAA